MKAKSDALQEQALALFRANPGGVTQDRLQVELNLDTKAVADLVNKLARSNLVDLLQNEAKQMVFKAKDAVQAMKTKGLTAEDLLVLQAITSSGSTGVWSRDIRRQTNLSQTTITKILKTLEGRQLVKFINSVNDGKRKIYVLFEVTPDRELTGGLWFAGSEMDTEFIQVLQVQCKKFIEEQDNRTATVQQMHRFFQEAKIANVPLGEDTISAIVRTLYYDQEVERVVTHQGEAWKIAGYQLPSDAPFTTLPCGVCPVIGACTPGGEISPEKCIYFDQYLQF